MAILNTSSFIDLLPINQFSLTLKENLRSSTDGKGQTLISSIGPRLWQGSISIAPTSHQKSREIIRLLQLIQEAGQSFDVYDVTKPNPDNLGSHNLNGITLSNVTPATRSRMNGVSQGFKLNLGEYVSLSVAGANRLFRTTTDTTGNAQNIAWITTSQPIPTSANGSIVTLIKAPVTCMLVPNSMKIGAMGLASWEGASFDFIQSFIP
ncbi:hypothetical protein [Ketogulonicigenium vulgare]|uniref:hypothetical protein n=1 Tax=Ketogulonicigenium vulgare TaxID=92945 RepID=UPI002358FC30|nr:hypothetical protein [Ketogulonicigenium vulgare]